jgi:hypothetical protein
LLGITTPLVRASALPGAPDALPAVLNAVQAEGLLSPPEAAEHDAAQVPRVRVMNYDPPSYRQNFDGFEPGMSAVDALFNYGPEALTLLRSGVRIEAG